MSFKSCEECGKDTLNGDCTMNAGEWGPTDDGIVEARLLTMLDEKIPVSIIMEDLRVCEAWLGHAMVMIYSENLCNIVCTL